MADRIHPRISRSKTWLC